ncbi:MAG: UDP-N-acetylmuramoyl-L-alanine--D-glutamate ligase [Actinomycetaceae bacterium]|nr:UDP-N-acetylmuramoyl-L-alanine--D-glutamate ligase [Actinomycetaceae bacterium]
MSYTPSGQTSIDAGHKKSQTASVFHEAIVIVVGLGTSGLAAAKALTRVGAHVIGIEENHQAFRTAKLQGVNARCANPEQMAQIITNEPSIDYVVISPGIPSHHPVFDAARIRGVELIGEVELAWRLQQESEHHDIPWLCVTGTNGKTTTVGLAVSMARAAGLNAVAVGNIGKPVVEAIGQAHADVFVVELSSFQLHTVTTMAPTASICLNIAEDHLDWHGSSLAYARDKAQIYERTQKFCIYNKEEPATVRMVEDAEVVEGARAVGIRLGIPAISEIGIVDDVIVDRAFIEDRERQAEELATFDDLVHLGQPLPALLIDILAAAALVRALDVAPSAISQGIRDFRMAAHRRALVGQARDLTWIDDSKATNTHAAYSSLKNMPKKSVIWIVGGDAKDQDFHQLVTDVAPIVRGAVVIGKDQTALRHAFEQCAPDIPRVHIRPLDPDETLETLMTEVVHEAVALSVPGNTVILAPACASWDQFDNYAQRGDLFAQVVTDIR